MNRSFVHDRTAKLQRDGALSQLQRTPGHPRSVAQRILELQRTIGNQAVGLLLRGTDRMSPGSPDRSSGEPLEPAIRLLMEARLGHDFSRVRIHTDQTAAQAAHRENAQAFTAGDDVVLGAREDSSQASGLLLAHELAHVAQQHRGGGAPGPAHEAEAAAVARAVAAGRTPVVRLGAARGSVQCADPPPPAVTPPSWLAGVPARHVEGNIWEVEFAVGGPHYVGPYDELGAFVKKTGLTADAHHIVGGEHLEDLGSSFSYRKAPAVALDPGLHEKVITPRIGAEQTMVGGRQGGRPQLSTAEVASMYRAAYTEQAPFNELATIADNITRQSTASEPAVSKAAPPTTAASPDVPPKSTSQGALEPAEGPAVKASTQPANVTPTGRLRGTLGQIAEHGSVAALGVGQIFLQYWFTRWLLNKNIREGFEQLEFPIRALIWGGLRERAKEHPEESPSTPLFAHVSVDVEETYDFLGTFTGASVHLSAVRITDEPLPNPLETRSVDLGEVHTYITYAVPVQPLP